MAKMSDAGVTTGGNWIKPNELAESERVFEITNATYRAAHDEFDEQVDFTIRYLDMEERDPDGDSDVGRFSLGYNPVRQKFIDWFADHPDEPINGVELEVGLMLYKGANGKKGNPPYLFRDATEA